MIEKCLEELGNGNLEEAIKLGKQAVEMYPDNFKAHLYLGMAYRDAGDTEKSLEYLKKAEELANNKEELTVAHYHTGEVLTEMGKLDDALSHLNKALELTEYPNEDKTYILDRIANIYFKKGELEKSFEYYNKALEEETRKKEDMNKKLITEIINNQGVILAKLGRYKEAIKLFEGLITLGITDNDPHLVCLTEINLGSAYSAIGDKNMAEKYLKSALDHAKELENKELEDIAYKYLNDILNNKNHLNKIKVEKIHPDSFTAYLYLGITYYGIGDLKKALESFEKAKELAGNNKELLSPAYFYIGATYREMNYLEEALESFKKAEELTDDEGILMATYKYIGEILAKINKLDDALIYFNKSLDLAKQANENIAHVLVEIANIYFNKEDLEKTLEYYNEAFEAGKKENADAKLMAEVIHNLGIISAKLGRYEDAIELFSTYANSNDPNTKCLFQIGLGLVYLMMRDVDEAEKYLKIGLNYAKEIKNKQLEAIAYMYLGKFFRRSDYLNIAKQLFREVYGTYR
jgi:tetratricopeptide (TPR) repeat protein